MIQRFSVNHKPRKDAEGEWGLYADHLEVVAKKDKEIIALKKEMQRITESLGRLHIRVNAGRRDAAVLQSTGRDGGQENQG